MSVPASVPKRSEKHLIRRCRRSEIRIWESYFNNSTTSPFCPFLAHAHRGLLPIDPESENPTYPEVVSRSSDGEPAIP